MTRGVLEETERRAALETYRSGLRDDVLPFWIRHGIDREHGGFLHCLDRDGSLMASDKSVWIHGRFSWLLATVSLEFGDEEALELARHGLDFLERHAFDRDGRMFFTLTREGRPLRKRRYLYSECFAVMARAAVARATGDEELARRALELFHFTRGRMLAPTEAEPAKVNPAVRPMRGLGPPMILLGVAHELRQALPDSSLDAAIDAAAAEIASFLHEPTRSVLETIGAEGEFLDTLEGRLLCPGHAIEAGWFLLRESEHRGGDARLRELGLKILDWAWKDGWDEEYGGLLYYRDARGLPPTEYWHDMKFWWPHNEAIVAALWAFRLSGETRWLERWRAVHEWSYRHFPDPEHGEWFGYLHRDGRCSTPVKGNLWKGPFHLPRMQLECVRILEEMA